MTAFTLKLFAMILMVGDHLHSFIPNQPLFLNFLGRLVAPIFVYFMVEGFFFTRSKFNYAKRLAIGAALMYAGNTAINMLLNSERPLSNNIFLTLFTSFCMIWAIDTGRNSIANKKIFTALPMFLLGIILAGVTTLFTEGSIFSTMSTLVFYFARNKKALRNIFYIATIFIVTILPSLGQIITNPEVLLFDFQWFSMFAIIPISLYNGERGLNNKFSKNLFYYFYPVHIWILYTIGTFLR